MDERTDPVVAKGIRLNLTNGSRRGRETLTVGNRTVNVTATSNADESGPLGCPCSGGC